MDKEALQLGVPAKSFMSVLKIKMAFVLQRCKQNAMEDWVRNTWSMLQQKKNSFPAKVAEHQS